MDGLKWVNGEWIPIECSSSTADGWTEGKTRWANICGGLDPELYRLKLLREKEKADRFRTDKGTAVRSGDMLPTTA